MSHDQQYEEYVAQAQSELYQEWLDEQYADHVYELRQMAAMADDGCPN